MNQFLIKLTATQQIGAMFVLVFGALVLASVAAFLLSLRERGDDAAAEAWRANLSRVDGVLRTSWVMVFVFWVGWLSGDATTLVLFALVSFFALREFMTLSPTRRGDHRSLILAFFIVLPIQYTLVGTKHFNLFTVFIPVYVFLAIPVVSALANDPARFLERNAKLRWQQVMADYLLIRRNLGGVVLLVDSRLGFTPLDRQLLEFVAPRVANGEVKLLVALTKADKLNRKEQQASLEAASAVLGELTTEAADVSMLLFSAPKRIGLDDMATTLYDWTHPAAAAPEAPAADPVSPT